MFKNVSKKTWSIITAVFLVLVVAGTFVAIQASNKKSDDCCDMNHHSSMSMKHSSSKMSDCCDMKGSMSMDHSSNK